MIAQELVSRFADIASESMIERDEKPTAKVFCCVVVANDAVAVASTGTTRYHDVPSLPTMQSSFECAPVIGHERFVTVAVAVGAFLNVTTLAEPTGHVPENVAALTCLVFRPSKNGSNDNGFNGARAVSAARTTRPIRSEDSSVN